VIATRWGHRTLLLFALITALGGALLPAAAAQTKDDLERAEAARDRAYEELVASRAELDAAIAAFEGIRSQIFDVTYRMERLETRITEDRAEARTLENAARELVVEAYINGTSGASVTIALEAESIQEVVTGQAIYERANALSISALDRLGAVSRELDRLSDDLEVEKAELQQLEVISQRAMERVNELLADSERRFNAKDDAARAALARYEAEQARKRAAEAARRARERAGTANGAVYDYLRCPSGAPMWFRNDWGNPRSGGRTHKGTDIFAAKGTKVIASIGGTVRIRNGGLGGKSVWLYGADGNAYYYAHLNSWKVSTGERVNKGQLIATAGNTGNASGGANHTHFQLHPGGGSPRNPYPTLAAICRR
jgi:murein DD-endopeptidase MepM/ murein hydrolase activator NlpD